MAIPHLVALLFQLLDLCDGGAVLRKRLELLGLSGNFEASALRGATRNVELNMSNECLPA